MSELEKDLNGIWVTLKIIASILIIPGVVLYFGYIIFKAPLIEKVVYTITALIVSIAFGFIPNPF